MSVVDDAGVLVPDASLPLRLTVSGGTIRAVDSGSNANHGPFAADHVTTFQGRALVMVAAGKVGKVVVTVSGEGLKDGVAEVNAVERAKVLSRSF